MRENPFRPGTKFPDLLEAKDTVIRFLLTMIKLSILMIMVMVMSLLYPE